MNKRGISPLVATVLIIGFTIVIASMVMIWGADIFQKYKSQTETESMIKLSCVTKINLNIKEACILGDTIKFKLENMGDKEISGFIIRTVGSSVNINKLDEKLSPFAVKSFEASFNANPVVGVGIPIELEVYPRIIYEGKEGTCDKTSINLKPCYKLPSLLSFDDWIEIDENNIGASGLVPEGYGNGIGIILSESGNVEIKSKSFVIPSEVKNMHVGGKTSENGNIIYNLKNLDGSDALDPSFSSANGNIEPTRDISALKGKEVYFYISVDGNNGDYAILNCLGYTNDVYGCA